MSRRRCVLQDQDQRRTLQNEKSLGRTASGMSRSSCPVRAASGGSRATYAAMLGFSSASSSWKGCRLVMSPQPMQITL